MFIDTHAHIDMEEFFPNIEDIINNAKTKGCKSIIIPGVEPKNFNRILNLVKNYDILYAALGIHPSEARLFNDKIYQNIYNLAQDKKVVAIGEIGLDYYWDKSFIDIQKETFIKQIKIANVLNKPIIIHDREAHQDTLDILLKYNKNSKVIMHCFSGSWEFATKCLDQGFYLALGGIVTFKNAKKPKEIAKKIPLEQLLLETDAPYLTPHPHRGEQNEPAFIPFIAEEIATLKNISIDEILEKTTNNAIEVFKL